MVLLHLATRRFHVNRDETTRLANESDIGFRIMPYQQVAWYFKSSGGYIVIPETHWNLLLNQYLSHNNKTQRYINLIHTKNGPSLILEAFIDTDKVTDTIRNDLALMCFMFFQNDEKINLIIDCGKGQGMQTTVYWKGFYLDLLTSTVYFDKHRYVDPYDMDADSKGFITVYNDSMGGEPNSLLIVESDQRLKKWKQSHPNAITISSKKRTLCKSESEHTPIVCHYMKTSFVNEISSHFDTVYIMQQCFESLRHLPSARRYVMCVDDVKTMSKDSKMLDPRKFGLFGISENIISSVLKDDTGVMINFLFASCVDPVWKNEEKKHYISPNVFSEL